jgi:HlyD family secretion protein
MRRTIIAVGIVAALAAAAYGYYRYTKKEPPPTIATARITRGDVADTVGATGTLQAVTTVQVGTQVSGTILQLNADFNSLVRKGQVLARLDPSLFQTQIEQARANLIRAEADLERLRVAADDTRTKLRRARELSEKKLIAQVEVEAAEVAVRSAEAQLKSQQAAVTQSQASLQQNQVNLAHTVIEAPIDGLVISRNVDVGQTVAASMSAPTLFLLAADLTKMQVIASLDESDVGRIRPGQLVRFRVDAFPAEEFTGKVTQVRLQPQTLQNVVTYSTVIDVPNLELKLKPGMTANVNIEIARRTNVLRVPNSALRFRPTNEIFAALGQTPPASGGPGRGTGGGPDTRMSDPSQPVAAQMSGEQQPQRSSENLTRPTDSGTRPAPSSRSTADSQSEDRRGGRGSPPGGGHADSSGGGRGFGGGQGDGRRSFSERLANMTPEQREQILQRMRARGFTPPGDAEEPGGQGRQAARQPAATATPSRSGATTIDALFAPLPVVETYGQVWLHQNGKLQRVRLRLGISDGQQTELIQTLDGELHEGTEVVTSVTVGAQRAATMPGGNAFPGLGGRQVFPGGGFPGGGNRGGGGGRGGR